MTTNVQTVSLDVALQQAVAHHQAGRLHEAEQIYRAILQVLPDHPSANHNLGVLAGQVGQHAAGLPYLKTALEVNPAQEQYALSYAGALLAAGQAGEALDILQAAMRRGVDTPAAQALRQEAEAAVWNSDAKSEALTPAEINQLVALFNAGQHAEIERRAHLLLERHPDFGFIWKIMGISLYAQGKEALPALQKAIELLPDDAEAYSNLGNVLQALGRLDDAVASQRRALEISPGYAEAHSNLGNALQEIGQLDSASASFRQAVQIKPDLAEAHYNLGNALRDMGQADDAIANYAQALEIKPDLAEAHFNLGLCLLEMGRYVEGWRKYEHRWEGFKPKRRRPATLLPQWSGQQPSSGDRLLVFDEQGMGDRLQFARYLSSSAERFAGGVSLVSGSALSALFRRSFPGVEILEATPADQSVWQWQCPLLSLPLAFGTTLETIPKRVPYLTPDPVRVACWQARIAELGFAATRKIGVVWKTGQSMNNALLRSLPLQQLAPLLNLPGCVWFGLQKEPDTDKTPWVASGRLIDWTEELGDFDETAALAMNLDLVISVDTAVVHLAGGLGLPTWLLNRHASEWRWMRDREDSPWYPTMRIFTQKNAGDWDEVVKRMAAALTNTPVQPLHS